jgi:hypothetical protein
MRLKKNDHVFLAHEIRVELILLLANQPLFYVHKTDVNLLEIKCDKSYRPEEKANLYLFRCREGGYKLMAFIWYLLSSVIEALF